MQKHLVVDAHTHVIEHIAGMGQRGESRALGKGRVRWANGEEAQVIPDSLGDTSFTYDKLVRLMDENRISKAVMMQGPSYGFCNDYTFEAQQKYPDRLYGMGTFDPYAHQSLRIMEHLIRDYHFRGLKFEVSHSYGLMGYHPDFRIDGDVMAPIFEFAQEQGLVVSLDFGTFEEPSFQIDGTKRIASRYPGIRFVMEHLFYPGANHFEEVRKALLLLAHCENASFTIASVPHSIVTEHYPFPSACRYLSIAKEIVGAGRLLWGSDLPAVLIRATYRQLIDYVAESGVFAEDELRSVYAENAVRLYDLEDHRRHHA